ncbi:PH domain-containing protein [Rufibacter glacialis]|uniref:PH domain-containing protein n=1 Tax=Rufibacter glacialis TaxID=1259555 RepID=A0A5M8QGL0_9BACT|nr:PH domain-containing protein [Rufibacter glacialis]KAA6433522.1 PH domain-containing protein [Rufibacter glacialis]
MASVTFYSSRSWVVALAVWGTTALLAALVVQEASSELPLLGKMALGLFCLLVSGLLLWTWFCTYYQISGETLYYRCGPLHGSIPIHKIRDVQLNTHLWAGLRPALGLHGLVINYHRWDTIYFSPAEKEAFLNALREVNPEIEVKA